MIMEFKALHVPSLNEEVAVNLETVLNSLPGIEHFTIALESKELSIKFDEDQLGFQTLAQKMATAGCSLHDIDAALLL